jgi:hypothetical protein
MGLWAGTTERIRLFCNCVVVIGKGENKDRINHAPNSCYFKNQQSSLDNHQSIAEKTRGLSTGIPADHSKVSGTLRCAVRD